MASTIITKNSSTASAVPVVGDLTKGELAVNVTDKKIYTKDNSAAVVKLVGSLGNQEANAVAITGGSIAGITDLAVADGGTGASTASDARTNLGLGTIATQAASSVTITGGSVTGITDITVADGGTGASTAANARSNLGAAASGANSDITSLSGLTTALSVAQGGTGITSFGSGVATFLGTPSSANLLAAVTDETGTGALVFANTPTLVAPILGTPTSGNFSTGSFTWPTFNQNTTGTAAGLSATLAIASGGTGQTTANAAFNALAPSQTSASGKYLKSDGTNTSWDALDISTADITGTLPVANGGTGVTSSTGTGSVVLSNSPTLVTPILGTPQSGNFSTGTFTWPTFNQNTTGTAAGLSATLATTSGGTGLTSFTSGGVVYASSTSALATGSALTFDGSTTLTLVTANTTATVAKFRATNYGNLGTTYISIGTQYDDGTSRIGSLNPTGNQSALVFETNTASSGVWQEGFRLTNSSLYTASGINVGIGTSSPSDKLTVAGSARIGTGTTTPSLLTLYPSASAKGWQISANNYVGSALEFTCATANGGTTFSTPSMLLDSAGNLGLGIAPSAWASGTKAFETSSIALYDYTTANFYMPQNAYFNGTNWIYKITSGASYYQQAQGSHTWNIAASGTAGNTISFTSAMTLNASGGLQTLNTIGVGNVTPSTSGAGITFPATQSASSDANTLDDYEEGTWTPTAGVDLTVVGTFSSSGTYTKIGRQVTVYGVLLSTTTVAWAGTNSQIVTGLPFTSNGDFPGTSMNGSRTQGAIIETSSTSIYAAQAMSATSAVTICVTYFV